MGLVLHLQSLTGHHIEARAISNNTWLTWSTEAGLVRCDLSASCSGPYHRATPTIMDFYSSGTLSQNKLFLKLLLVIEFYYSNRKELLHSPK